MKNTKILKIGDKKYELYFTIGDMRKIERRIGRSLNSIIMHGPAVVENRMTIDAIIASLQYGLHDKERTEEEIYDLIDTYCSQADQCNIDTLGGFIILAYFETGFFIPKHVLESKEKEMAELLTVLKNGQGKPKK